ncbi:MAG: Benzoate--CoA ligase [Gammaproteobacteria bacterium]|nr:Benzoate--CoA ligase [Gammaproteobacteria bacterium]
MNNTAGTPTIASLAAEIGFWLPRHYNASRLLYDNLDTRGNNRVFVCDESTWSYNELAAEASRAGSALLDQGAEPGDRVLMCLDDVPAYPAAVMGSMRAGLVPVLVNTLSRPDLVRFFLEDSEARVAVVSPAYRSHFTREALRGTACRAVIVAGEETAAGQHGWETVRRASDNLPEAPTTQEDMALWMYSSGSTGKPKAVVHRHADPPYTAAAYGRHILGIQEDDVCFSIPKIFFAYGFGNSVTFPMSVGACAVLMPGRPDKTAETMRGEWIYTGDRFVCDADGFYFYKGRTDDLVKVSGQWVYPLEVELALAEHPKVLECCVQALPLADQRMTLHAWVVATANAPAGAALEQELQAYAKSALLPHKYPRRIEFLESLPKTGTGKIDRQALTRMWR